MVNIIKFEFRKNFLSLLSWLLVATLLSIVYLSVYPTFSDATVDWAEFMKTYPPEMLNSLNINPEYITQMEGYYPMVIGFIQLISFAFASTLTLKIFCMEYKNKSVEFLLAKPRSRATFFNAKILSVLLLNTIFFLLISLIDFAIISALSDMSFKNFFTMQITIYIIMIISSLITSVFAVKFSKVRGYGGIGFIFAFGFYFLNVMSNILDEEKLRYLSIYGVFDFNDILTNGYDITILIILAIISIACYIISLVAYKRKDVL